MLVLLSALLVVRASDIFQEDLLIRPIAEASSTSSDLPAAAAFHRAFLTSSYKERANKVKQTLKTKHSGAHVEPIPRTATHIPFLSLKLLFVGIWDSARGARPANCRGVQQHLRAAHCCSIPGTGLQGCAEGDWSRSCCQGAAPGRRTHHLQRPVHLQSSGTPGQQVCCVASPP